MRTIERTKFDSCFENNFSSSFVLYLITLLIIFFFRAKIFCMKKLQDYADDINKCSKCGLCQSVCPVYKIMGNDCAVSRGKFVMLDGVLKGDLKLNKNIEKYLDLCLKCGKCKDFCPSDIDVCKIFDTAKHECARKSFWGRVIFFLESEFVFGNVLKFLKLFRVRKIFNAQNPTLKLLYFKGCVNEVNPAADRAIAKILKNTGIQIVEKNFDCCGTPFLSSGNLERYEKVKEKNLRLIKETEFDYLVADCASCQDALNNYGENIRCINILEIISKQNIKFKFKHQRRVTFHKPCHLRKDDFVKVLFEKCENVEYVEMKDYDECCGFAGEFALKNPKISREISSAKIDNAIATDADVILTTCPACILGLIQGSIGKKSVPKIQSLIEFLADADEIINC